MIDEASSPLHQESGITNIDTEGSGIGSSSSGGVGHGLSQLALGSSNNNLAPIPDVLLSHAKDNRYVSDVVSLLSQVIVPYASIFLLPTAVSNRSSPRGDGAAPTTTTTNTTTTYDDDIILLEDDGQLFVERIRPELNLLASLIVHSATFIYYTRNFGGGSDSNNNIINNDVRWNESSQRSLGMESLNLAYQYPTNKKRIQQNATITKRNNKLMMPRMKKYLLRMIPSRNVLNPYYRLLILQTFVPYIIQRVGRGGWSKDLGSILSSFIDQFSGLWVITPYSTLREQVDDDDDDNLLALRNNERLRGSARRRLFEEQRHRMLSSSSQVNSNSSDMDNSETELNGLSNNAANINAETTGQTLHQHQSSTLFDRRLKRISTSSWNLIRRISLAMSSLSHGAHQLPRHQSNSNESLDRYTKIIKWFLRLHLAMFYWNGAYPTVSHRLAGVKLRDNVAPYSPPGNESLSGNIVANRPSYKPIAIMILFQAAAAFGQTAAEASIEVAHYLQVSFFRWRRRKRLQNQQGLQRRSKGRLILDDNNSERAEYMDLIEERVPGISSIKKNDDFHAKKHKQGGSLTADIHPCGICLNERVHPAASSLCGHVFCWNCILHWVSNVRAECPLCRAKTRPQDIVALYNYC